MDRKEEQNQERNGQKEIFAGKVAVVTGASRGIGRAIALELARKGAMVVINYNGSEERAQEVQKCIEEEGNEAAIMQCDVSDFQACEAFFKKVIEQFGRLDILVNNAGIMDDMSPVGDMTDEMLDRVMKINGYAPIYAMRKAVQVFLKQEKGGNIINVTSVGVDHNTAGAAYAASKAAVAAVSRNVTFQYMSQKIRCNNIAPGGISTEISKSMGMPNMVGFGNVKKLLGIAPEMGSAEDIANAALYLASDESKYVNGAVITVDGGWTCL